MGHLFSDETIQFLWGIRFNNERSWFQAHKEEYLNTLYRPMQDLGAHLLESVGAENPDLEMQLRVTRIYRDARRVRYGGPYKEHLWLSLERPYDRDDWHGGPSLWFEIAPEGYEYGCGYWGAPRDMERYRRTVLRKREEMERLARRLARQERFQLGGETYRRPKLQLSELLDPWVNRKGIMISHASAPDELLCSPDLWRTVADGFCWLLPYYRFFDALRLEPPVTDRIM